MVSATLYYFNGNDLTVELSVFPGIRRSFIGLNGVIVLIFPAELVFSRAGICTNTHGILIVNVDKAIFLHSVYQGGRAEFLSVPHMQVMGDKAHIFHSSRNSYRNIA